MYLYVNAKREIKSVNTPVEGLIGLYVDETLPEFPFKNWSEAKICCYKVDVKDGIIMMMTPYLDSRMLDHINQLGLDGEENARDIISTQVGLADTYEQTGQNTFDIMETQVGLAETYEISSTNTQDILACEMGLAEVYEMIITDVAAMIEEALGGN